MITISQAVERSIAGSPLYGEALLQDIVNYSAVARKIQPAVEEILLEKVTEGAITIALKRYASELRKHCTASGRTHPIRNISLQSDLSSLIYQNSPVLEQIHHKLLQLNAKMDIFIHFTQGSHESSFLVSDSAVAVLKKLAAKEHLVAEYRNLSAISVRMPPEVMLTIGVFAPFVQALAWLQISVYQIVSHFTEITFVVSDNDAERAFAAMKAIGRR